MKRFLPPLVLLLSLPSLNSFTPSPALRHSRHSTLTDVSQRFPSHHGTRCSRYQLHVPFYNRFDTSLPQGPLIVVGLTLLQNASAKFRARPVTYLLIPCVAAGVGWLTNWLAVQMIFYPIQYWGLPIYRRPEVPLGLIGWQGIVPCKTRKMTITMVDLVTSQLLSVSEAFARLDPRKVAQLLAPEIPNVVNDIVADVLPPWMKTVYRGVDAVSHSVVAYFTRHFLVDLTKGLQQNIDQVLSLQDCVVAQMLQDRTRLGILFRKCGQRELDFLVNSGLWFGFLLGVIQMLIALVWDNPWSLSIGGGIVGLATNWLALKWIFEPVDPIQIGKLRLQGMFLQRQPEVALEFSQYFANNVLTAEQLWKSVLTNPNTLPSFATLFGGHLTHWMHKLTRVFGVSLASEKLTLATNNALSKLPNHVHVLYPYMDEALGLQQTLHDKMLKMSSRQFERVLHPIFEEDELTLILAGAALGFAAGLIQQGLETGVISVAKTRDFAVAFCKNPLKETRAILRNTKNSCGQCLQSFAAIFIRSKKTNRKEADDDDDESLSIDRDAAR